MVAGCSVYGCTNQANKASKLQFYNFPLSNPKLLDKWIKAVKRPSWQPTRHSCICSVHFAPDSYKKDAKSSLKDEAVPTIFNFPVHLKEKSEQTRHITKHQLSNIVKESKPCDENMLVQSSLPAAKNVQCNIDSSKKKITVKESKPCDENTLSQSSLPVAQNVPSNIDSSNSNHDTILFIQLNNIESRTYTYYKSVKDCLEGLCQIHEKLLKAENPNLVSIFHSIKSLFKFIDEIADICCLVYEKQTNTYVPHSKIWIKDKICDMFNDEDQS